MNYLFLVPIVAIAVLLGIIASGYVKAPPDTAFIISGLRKKPKMLMGKSGIKIPFLERKDELLAKQISVDIKTNGYIPTLDFIGVDVDAIAKIQIDTSDASEGLRFLKHKDTLDRIDIIMSQMKESDSAEIKGLFRTLVCKIFESSLK